MNERVQKLLTVSVLIIVGAYFLFLGLTKAKEFIIPITIAGLLSMMLLPVVHRLEGLGFSKGWAVFFSDIFILAIVVGLSFLIANQVDRVAEDWPEIKKRLEPRIEQVQQYIQEKFNISIQEQKKQIEETIPGDQNKYQSNQEKTGGDNSLIKKTAMNLLNFTGNFLLTFVYIFFFMYYRKKFRKSLLKLVPEERREATNNVISQSSKVAQQYLIGRFLLILFLAILYAIGFLIIGIKYALFIAIIAALLSLIPYIGNIIGGFLALGMAFISGGGISTLIGVVIVFSIVQFIESYMLEPFVVGHKVDLNPVFTILSIVLGGAVWGTAGMILAIPLLGILKVVFDNVKRLEPLGYALDERDLEEGSNWFKSFEQWFSHKIRRK